ncbi:MAG: hypothetical protein ACPGUU_07260 [Flavobacteriaceae bacterium]
MKSIYKITLLLFLIPLVSFGNNDTKRKHEKSKTISKKFNVNRNATVEISNKYGNVHVTTWDKNSVEFEIKITVKGDSESKVERKLDDIDVIFDASSSFVEAKTIINKNKSGWSFWGKNNNLNYKINYTVKMPKSNNANLNNDYGSISLDELKGVANINCDYGKITVGDLLNSSNSINLDYCSKSTVNFAKNVDVNVDYSKLAIDKSGNVKLNTDYSTIELGEAKDVTFNSDYGSIKIEDAVKISGTGDYTSFRFGTIRKSLSVTTDYGSIRVNNLAKGFDFVDIDSEYAGIRIGVAPDASFKFDIGLQYASFRYDKDKVDMQKRIVKNNKKSYQGTFGKGNTSSKVKIRSEYGGVSIKENN